MALNIEKAVFDRLSESEQRVAEFLDSNQDLLGDISITMIANRTSTSPSTVSRTISKIGYSGGIAQLRYAMLQQSRKEDSEDIRGMNKVLAKSYRESILTIDKIIVTDILKVIRFIKDANRIILFALGTSAMIARIFQEQLIALGYTPILIDDTLWMKRSDFKMNSDDLSIVLTARNTESALYLAATRAKHQGAKLVTCTCKKGTNLEKISDVTIFGYSEDTVAGYVPHASRLPLMIITRTIIEYLAQ